jgi:hypothetical protein
MIWKGTLKYPVLIIGIILFGLYLNDPKTKQFWSKYSGRYIPNTCRAVMDRVEVKAPDYWSFECPGTQLLKITIQSQNVETKQPLIRQAIYKELANAYKTLGRFSNPETLEYLKNIEISVVHTRLSVKSKTDGQAVVQMISKVSPTEIANHLKLTVKVKEFKK